MAPREAKNSTDSGAEKGSNMISRIGGNTNLANIGQHLGLTRYIGKNKAQGQMISTRVMSATVEAIIGAVFLDCNYDIPAVRQVMETIGIEVR